jgi:hypothetical protein
MMAHVRFGPKQTGRRHSEAKAAVPKLGARQTPASPPTPCKPVLPADRRPMDVRSPKNLKLSICGLAFAPCIMHDIAAADLYGPPHPLSEECSSMARAPVSKTGGCRFESCHSCQAQARS